MSLPPPACKLSESNPPASGLAGVEKDSLAVAGNVAIVGTEADETIAGESKENTREGVNITKEDAEGEAGGGGRGFSGFNLNDAVAEGGIGCDDNKSEFGKVETHHVKAEPGGIPAVKGEREEAGGLPAFSEQVKNEPLEVKHEPALGVKEKAGVEAKEEGESEGILAKKELQKPSAGVTVKAGGDLLVVTGGAGVGIVGLPAALQGMSADVMQRLVERVGEANQRYLEDCAVRLLCIFALDRQVPGRGGLSRGGWVAAQ